MVKNNHVPKGSSCLVEPIRELKDIEAIKKMLVSNTRDELLFCLSINNGLRMSDILQLKIKDLIHLKPGEMVNIKEKKTGKANVVCLNKQVFKILHQYLEDRKPYNEDEYIFISKKGNNKPLQVSTASLMVKRWCKSINLIGNFGSHSLRKTWGYHQRTRYGVETELLMKRFCHSNMGITLRYIGLQDKQVNDLLLNEI